MVADLGVRWVRDTVDWTVMEPTAGQYAEFPSAFRERLDFYKAHDIGVVFMVAYDNYKAYQATASNPSGTFEPVAFANYAVAAAQRLRSAGVRFVLELWNEPHNMVLRPTLGGAWNGAAPSPWVDYYARMVGEAVRRVKAYDSSIRLLTNDDMWVLHYWFLEAGLPSNLDGFAFHPYVKGLPERSAVQNDTDWVKPYVAVDADGSFGSAVRRLRERGTQKLSKSPEMWITEWGWPVGEAKADSSSFTEETVASWLPRAFITAEAAGTETLCWFSSQDNVDGPMGLTANDGKKRKSYYTYKTLSDNFGDFTYVGQIAGADHPTTGTQAYLFQRGTSGKIAVWNIEPSLAWLKLDATLTSAVVIDCYGKLVSTTRGAMGADWLPLDAAPIYLDFQLQDAIPSLVTAERSGPNAP